jgi:hypothetical protein
MNIGKGKSRLDICKEKSFINNFCWKKLTQFTVVKITFKLSNFLKLILTNARNVINNVNLL